MTITNKQLSERNKGIGSSEVCAIIGRDEWKTSWDIWAQKTGRAEPTKENEAMRLGTALERVLLDLAEVELCGKIVAPSSTFVRGICRANVDGMLGTFARGSEIVEAKTTSQNEGWGPSGSDLVPERVMFQVHHQMLCADSPRAHVARLTASFGFKFSLYTIERNDDLCNEIEARCSEWWTKHIVNGEEPQDSGTLPVLKSIIRNNDQLVTLPRGLIGAERDAKQALAIAEENHNQAQAAMLTALGQGKTGTDGVWTIRASTVNRKSPDMTEIIKAYPACATMLKHSSFTRFDIKAAKEIL